jgi:hypothetical protein
MAAMLRLPDMASARAGAASIAVSWVMQGILA